jgi:hypothetical protein
MKAVEAVKNETREFLTVGEPIYGVVRHVSQSGMSRVIDFYVMRENHPVCISGRIAEICELRRHKRYDGLMVYGCGMDMVFSTVYDLGYKLYPHGFTPNAGYSRNGTCQTHEPDGGYAFRHASL